MGINLHLTALAQQATVDPKRLKQKIARTQRLVEESVDIVHQFSRELRPTLLDDLGLVLALHAFMKDFTKRTGIHIGFTTFSADRITGLDSARSTVLYRVAQEALLNVAKHAHASHVEISLRKLPAAIELKITDDGRGFAMEWLSFPNASRRMGVLGMRERVQMIGGQFSLESAPGQGATMRAEIPLAGGREKRGVVV
jgi:signal transduction histidine kinase